MKIYLCFVNIALLLIACSSQNTTSNEILEEQNKQFADVIKVSISGKEGAYNFSVMLNSPDMGCNQYADWWEVIAEDGSLLYRRILAHSHVGEQPFTRSGGGVKIISAQVVWVRAHINNKGYGGITMKGSKDTGFEVVEMPDNFAINLETTQPLPDGCAF